MQGKRIVVVFGSGRINARQMIAVEHHGDRLVDGVELVKEVGGRLVGQSRTLLIGFDGLLLIVLQRSVRSGFGLEIVVLIPIVVCMWFCMVMTCRNWLPSVFLTSSMVLSYVASSDTYGESSILS